MRSSNLRPLLAFAVAAAVVPARDAASQEPLPSAAGAAPSISASGRAETRVTPDRATVLLTVETRAPTAAAASAENARRQRATLDALGKLGIAPAQLATAGYNVTPEQRYVENQPPQIVGYVARSTVRAEVRRIDQVGPVIDAALGAGSNAVGGVRFAASNIDVVRRSALDSAVANACQSAAAVARASGKALGELLQASVGDEGGNYGVAEDVQFSGATMRAQAAPTPINAGELTVVATVSTRWSLLPVGAEGARQCR